MNSTEFEPNLEELMSGLDFDINAAFQEAVQEVANDAEIEIEEKIMRMETIISEGNNETYRDFVDFRAMAMQIEMFCSHDHALNQSLQGSEIMADFLSTYRDNTHDHDHSTHKDSHEDDEAETKKGKKKKKKRKSWFGFYYSA